MNYAKDTDEKKKDKSSEESTKGADLEKKIKELYSRR